MFANVLNEITSRLDARFILTLFLSSLVFWGGLAAVYATDSGLETSLTRWRAQDTDVQLLQVVLALAWVTFFAYLLNNQLVWLTKQFEGCWQWIPLIGQRLMRARQRHYQRVLADIDTTVDYERIYYAFPFPNEPEEVMPTRLGNILKNSERYAYQRYDMDAVLLWPRLYAVLPESFVKTLAGAKASLDFMLVVSSLSVLFALVAGLYLIVVQSAWWVFLVCFLGGLVVAWLAYKSSLEAAITYGQLIKSAFDLYKGELCKQLGYKQPNSLEGERALWASIYQLIYKGEVGNPELLRYSGDEGPEPSTLSETES